MSLSYAKRNSGNDFVIKEINNIESEERNEISNDVNTFLVDTRYMIKDDVDNIWIYSPLEDKYYLYYIKSKDIHTMTCYPTITASISEECKMGLRLYKEPKASSDTIKRFKNQNIQITSKFRVDSGGNIWVYCVIFDMPTRPKVITEGWVVYKNKRNNFLNLIIYGDKKVVTKNGELDEEKVKEFSDYLFLLDTSYEYRFGSNWLQIFAESTDSKIAKVSAVNKKDIKINPATLTKYSAYKGTRKSKSPGKEGKYNYSMNYQKDNIYNSNLGNIEDKRLKKDMQQLYRDINFEIRSEKEMYEKNFTRYNRFKLANPEDYLGKGFAHIFFTRPDCALINDANTDLRKKIAKNPNFSYAWAHRRRLLRSLTLNKKDVKHDWNLLLSNKAEEFSLSDENIATETYGDTFLKQKVVFGKGSHESRTQGEFSVKYTDNRELDIYHYHKLWTDYISNVYTGSWFPKRKYIYGKVLDYAVCAYYILTAEDGETILFWSKYYGVFPVNTPSSSYSWSKGQAIVSPEVNITYQYSLKEDFNPISLIEFNLNSHLDEVEDGIYYEPVYNKYIGGSGKTWVGAPFIETCGDKNSTDYVFKLRFKHVKSDAITD